MSTNVYQIVTDRIVQALENSVVPWHRPWRSSGPPTNLVSKKPYRGINVFLLSAMRHASPYWLTFNQAKGLGGTVKKGEKSSPVVFWKIFDDRKNPGKKIPMLRYYNVFNTSQCEGITTPVDETQTTVFDPIERCENIVAGYPNRPALDEESSQASYTPGNDTVHMPPRVSFDSAEEYYSSMYHELVHSTGHATRLKRDGIINSQGFGSHSYSFEELIAELGASLLCDESYILDTTFDNSVAYIQGWLSKLKSNPTWVVKAASDAAKACDYILARTVIKDEETELVDADGD